MIRSEHSLLLACLFWPHWQCSSTPLLPCCNVYHRRPFVGIFLRPLALCSEALQRLRPEDTPQFRQLRTFTPADLCRSHLRMPAWRVQQRGLSISVRHRDAGAHRYSAPRSTACHASANFHDHTGATNKQDFHRCRARSSIRPADCHIIQKHVQAANDGAGAQRHVNNPSTNTIAAPGAVVPWHSEERPANGNLAEEVGRQTLIETALAALPPDYRAPLLLYAHHGFSIAQVAEALNLSEGAARMRLHRARTLFRQVYRKEDRA